MPHRPWSSREVSFQERLRLSEPIKWRWALPRRVRRPRAAPGGADYCGGAARLPIGVGQRRLAGPLARRLAVALTMVYGHSPGSARSSRRRQG
eukprot:6681386-Prymnesium_polylepis.1